MPLPVTDARPLFRPLCEDMVRLLRALAPDDWLRPTVAGSWRVRDVVAHLLDTALRRLSFHRDRLMAPEPERRSSALDLVAVINELNSTWVRVATRFSPRVLTDLYAVAGAQLADFMEALDLEGPAIFAVSWAGHTNSPQWLDIGREFTEVWHHGAQIRDAVEAGPFRDPRWLRAVLEIAVHVLPHGYRDVPARSGSLLVVEITGDAGGVWTLHAEPAGRWQIEVGRHPQPSTIATMTGDTAWRLWFNALSLADARALVHVEGDAGLAEPLFRARSVIV